MVPYIDFTMMFCCVFHQNLIKKRQGSFIVEFEDIVVLVVSLIMEIKKKTVIFIIPAIMIFGLYIS